MSSQAPWSPIRPAAMGIIAGVLVSLVALWTADAWEDWKSDAPALAAIILLVALMSVFVSYFRNRN